MYLPLRSSFMRYKLSMCSVLLLPLVCSSALADWDGFEEGYFKLKGSAGITQLSAENAHLGVDRGMGEEVDTVTFNDEDAAMVALGVGYVFLLTDEDEDFRWFPAVVPSIDGSYQFEKHFSGDVYMWGDPALDNFNNNTHVENFNLMFNVTLAVAEYQRWTAFVLGGIGAAWTWVGYDGQPKAGSPPESELQLHTKTNTTFAFQGGAGIGFELMPELDLTLTYLFTDLGNVETSDSVKNSNANQTISPANFDLQQQSLLLGLEWNFI
jgi:opacity protein-like surface antigen